MSQIAPLLYDEIAAIVDKTEVACRQIFSRARGHVSAHRPRFESSPDRIRALHIVGNPDKLGHL